MSVGDEALIAEKCCKTEHLDMSLNLFYDINEILKVLHLMPRLISVQLKGIEFTADNADVLVLT